MKIILTAVLLCLSINAFAKDPHLSTKWQNPSPLHHAFDDGLDAPMQVFHGMMTLDGVVHLYWMDNAELWVSFTPTPFSRNRLPFISDDYHEKNIKIRLNSTPLDKPVVYNDEYELISTHAPLPDSEKMIRENFKDIPASFWQNKTGELSRPAAITINAFGMNVECDKRQYFATATDIKPLAQKTQIKPVTGC